jgi:hypothetical protein
MFAPNRLSEKDRVASIHQIKDINYPRNHVSKYLTIIKNFKPVRLVCNPRAFLVLRYQPNPTYMTK